MKQLSSGVARILVGTVVLAALAILFMLPLAGRGSADTVVQEFQAKTSLNFGRIVALSGKDTVVAAPANDTTKIFGVVIDQNLAPVVVTTQNGQVYVATGGTYPVLVSDENGAIKSNDYISLSSTDGIGAKATASQTNILGQATSAFDGKNSVIAMKNVLCATNAKSIFWFSLLLRVMKF